MCSNPSSFEMICSRNNSNSDISGGEYWNTSHGIRHQETTYLINFHKIIVHEAELFWQFIFRHRINCQNNKNYYILYYISWTRRVRVISVDWEKNWWTSQHQEVTSQQCWCNFKSWTDICLELLRPIIFEKINTIECLIHKCMKHLV